MTAQQRKNISRGLREARRRRRLSAALKAYWAKRQTEGAPEVRNSTTPIFANSHQLIAYICRELNLSFTLEHLDELVQLCEAYHTKCDS